VATAVEGCRLQGIGVGEAGPHAEQCHGLKDRSARNAGHRAPRSHPRQHHGEWARTIYRVKRHGNEETDRGALTPLVFMVGG
jgi:hypothetical protein